MIQKIIPDEPVKPDPLGAYPKYKQNLSIRMLGYALVEKIETESDSSPGADISFKEELMVYWGAEDKKPSSISPQDRFFVFESIWEPVGGLVEYPLGVKLKLRKAGTLRVQPA